MHRLACQERKVHPPKQALCMKASSVRRLVATARVSASVFGKADSGGGMLKRAHVCGDFPPRHPSAIHSPN